MYVSFALIFDLIRHLAINVHVYLFQYVRLFTTINLKSIFNWRIETRILFIYFQSLYEQFMLFHYLNIYLYILGFSKTVKYLMVFSKTVLIMFMKTTDYKLLESRNRSLSLSYAGKIIFMHYLFFAKVEILAENIKNV